MLIVDGHEDLAYNTLVDGRDYLQSALAIRASEEGGPVPECNGECMLGLPEWLRGGVGLVIATLLTIPRHEAHLGEPGYLNPEGAHQIALAQVDIYRQWAASRPQIMMVTHRHHLDEVVESWAVADAPVESRKAGLVLLIENADAVRTPAEVGCWYEQGVRLIGPAWHSNRYTTSTKDDSGGLKDAGWELLDEMQRCGMILDLSHMSDEACAEALVRYQGPVVATHANPRQMVPWHRLLSDETIGGIVAHNGVVGMMPANWALDPTWSEHRDKTRVHLEALVDAIDAVCQIAGDTAHVGSGTDFDGGQGAECAPAELDTIADLPKLGRALSERGYAAADVDAIMGGNWLRLLRAHLLTA